MEDLIDNTNFLALDLLPKRDDIDVILEIEKERLSRDLHDEVGQVLASIKLNVEAIKLHARNSDVLRLAESIEAKILAGHAAVGEVINNLKPKVIATDVSLTIKTEFLRRLKESQINVVFGKMDETIVLSQIKCAQLYYIVGEVITNIILHSRATEVRASLYQRNLRLHMVIEDNGIGMDNSANKFRLSSNGLAGIKHRAALLNGSVDFSKSSYASEFSGTRVALSIPY